MKLFGPVGVTLCLALAVPFAGSGQIINPANNHSYYLIGPGTWTFCQAQAVSLGGNLVTIREDSKNMKDRIRLAAMLATDILGQAGTTSYCDTNAPGPGSFFYRVGIRY
jgi:hypothetical protein